MYSDMFRRRFSQYSRGRGYRDWRTRGDPTLINSLWRSRQPLGIRKQLGEFGPYHLDFFNTELETNKSIKHPYLSYRERRGVHSTSATDRVCDGSGGVLALRQLLVAGTGGHSGGRLTRGGGRVHARVAPAVRGGGPRQRRLAVAGAAAAGAATRARARVPARRSPPLPRHLPPAAVRHASPAPNFLTGASTPLLSAA